MWYLLRILGIRRTRRFRRRFRRTVQYDLKRADIAAASFKQFVPMEELFGGGYVISCKPLSNRCFKVKIISFDHSYDWADSTEYKGRVWLCGNGRHKVCIMRMHTDDDGWEYPDSWHTVIV